MRAFRVVMSLLYLVAVGYGIAYIWGWWDPTWSEPIFQTLLSVALFGMVVRMIVEGWETDGR